jgi:hypothetical protein
MLIKNEVIKALQEIMVRCNEVVNYNLFDLDTSKTHLIL